MKNVQSPVIRVASASMSPTTASIARAGAHPCLRRALEAGGVEFIPENGGGPGVRLRKA